MITIDIQAKSDPYNPEPGEHTGLRFTDFSIIYPPEPEIGDCTIVRIPQRIPDSFFQGLAECAAGEVINLDDLDGNLPGQP